MKRCACELIILAATLCCLAVGVLAAATTVTPASPGPWTWTAAHMAALFFANYGPAVDEGHPFPYGSGAFYAMCGESGNSIGETPGTVWLGIDRLDDDHLMQGLPIDRVKTLQFSTYVSTWSTYRENDRDPRWPRQPVQVQIPIADASGNRGYLMYRPWGLTGEAGQDGRWTGMWQDWDAISCSSTEDLWYEAMTGETFSDWSAVLARFGAGSTQPCKLVPTSTGGSLVPEDWPPTDPLAWRSTGWDKKSDPPGWPPATGTGKTFDFEVGARKSATDVFGQARDFPWWKESFSFRGYLDNATIGVDFDGDGDDADPGERVNYDFESEYPPVTKVGITCANCFEFDPGIMGKSFIDRSFRFKVVGVVASSYGLPAITDDEFYVWDGSYAWIYDKEEETKLYQQAFVVVHAPGHNAQSGEVWAALGDVRASLWLNQPYSYIWTNLGDCLRVDSP